MSLVLPGIGHFSINQFRQSISLPGILFLGIALIGWSGLFFWKNGSWILLAWVGAVYVYAFVDLVRKARSKRLNLQKDIITDSLPVRGSAWWHTLIYVCISLTIALLLIIQKSMFFGFQIYRIPSASMLPTLKVGDLIVADTRWFSLKQPVSSDIVVFKRSQKDKIFYIKRIIVTSEQTVEINDGLLKINGQIFKENIRPKSLKKRKIATDHYFLIGDNFNHSFDSRHWGEIPRKNIVGKYRRKLFAEAKPDS
ncbi:signal peptidase I [Aliikangiella coralliicola]|nr:signal peptidase I [Aliikangiella coralliicola]